MFEVGVVVREFATAFGSEALGIEENAGKRKAVVFETASDVTSEADRLAIYVALEVARRTANVHVEAEMEVAKAQAEEEGRIAELVHGVKLNIVNIESQFALDKAIAESGVGHAIESNTAWHREAGARDTGDRHIIDKGVIVDAMDVAHETLLSSEYNSSKILTDDTVDIAKSVDSLEFSTSKVLADAEKLVSGAVSAEGLAGTIIVADSDKSVALQVEHFGLLAEKQLADISEDNAVALAKENQRVDILGADKEFEISNTIAESMLGISVQIADAEAKVPWRIANINKNAAITIADAEFNSSIAISNQAAQLTDALWVENQANIMEAAAVEAAGITVMSQVEGYGISTADNIEYGNTIIEALSEGSNVIAQAVVERELLIGESDKEALRIGDTSKDKLYAVDAEWGAEQYRIETEATASRSSVLAIAAEEAGQIRIAELDNTLSYVSSLGDDILIDAARYGGEIAAIGKLAAVDITRDSELATIDTGVRIQNAVIDGQHAVNRALLEGSSEIRMAALHATLATTMADIRASSSVLISAAEDRGMKEQSYDNALHIISVGKIQGQTIKDMAYSNAEYSREIALAHASSQVEISRIQSEKMLDVVRMEYDNSLQINSKNIEAANAIASVQFASEDETMAAMLSAADAFAQLQYASTMDMANAESNSMTLANTVEVNRIISLSIAENAAANVDLIENNRYSAAISMMGMQHLADISLEQARHIQQMGSIQVQKAGDLYSEEVRSMGDEAAARQQQLIDLSTANYSYIITEGAIGDGWIRGAADVASKAAKGDAAASFNAALNNIIDAATVKVNHATWESSVRLETAGNISLLAGIAAENSKYRKVYSNSFKATVSTLPDSEGTLPTSYSSYVTSSKIDDASNPSIIEAIAPGKETPPTT